MFKKLITVVLLYLVTITTSFAQKKEFANLQKYRNNGSGPILENDNLLGYYAFYMYDKADKKNDAYMLQLMDDNLNIVKSVDILRPSGDYLIETVFNGKTFVSVFYNRKKGIEFLSFDKSGKTNGSYLEAEPAKWEERRLAMSMMDEESVANASVFPTGQAGFVRQSFTKNEKLGYKFQGFDNNMKLLWTVGSSETSEKVETADILYTSEKYIGVMIARKKNLMTKDVDMFFSLIDSKTGKVIFEKPWKDEQEMSILNVFMNPEETELYVFGEYWPKGEEMMKAKSEGVVTMMLDVTGKEVIKKKYSWKNDLNKILKTEDNTMLTTKDNVRTYFHRIHMTKSGNIFAIGEQYAKAASALGIASRAMGGGGSVVQLNILNMVVLELGKDLSLVSFNGYPKKKTSVDLPQGLGGASSNVIAMYVKQIGGFDYEFSSFEKNRDLFASVYRDYDRKGDDGKKADIMFGILKLEDGKLSGTRMPISINSNYFRLNPAKPGYVTIVEYFKKKKTISFRIEKLVY